jgi:hypothetical protein
MMVSTGWAGYGNMEGRRRREESHMLRDIPHGKVLLSSVEQPVMMTVGYSDTTAL